MYYIILLIQKLKYLNYYMLDKAIIRILDNNYEITTK